jgi:hypothetical protein
MPRVKYVSQTRLPSLFEFRLPTPELRPPTSGARLVHGHVNQPKAEKRGWPSSPATRAALIRARTRGRGTGTSTRPACSWRAPPRAAPRGHARERARRRTPWAPARPCTGCTRSTCRGSSAGSTPAAPSPPAAPPFRHPARCNAAHIITVAREYTVWPEKIRRLKFCGHRRVRRDEEEERHTYLLLLGRRATRSLEPGKAGGLEKQAEKGDLELARRGGG